ncbi:MAG: PepSY domain-containing protein [Candidatus Rokubacteria bacterium]|nr:PepSY domain-containing protein [Candidatus Rokubacteria bacterium]
MKRALSVTLVVAVVFLLAGAALAFMGPAGMPMRMGGMMGMGPGMMGMGPGMMGMGPGMMGAGTGEGACPGMGAAAAEPISEAKAKELAQQYADKYLKGFTVEKVLPFTGMHHTMYSVELKGPKDEVRTLHINPWGNVMPFGGPGRRAG